MKKLAILLSLTVLLMLLGGCARQPAPEPPRQTEPPQQQLETAPQPEEIAQTEEISQIKEAPSAEKHSGYVFDSTSATITAYSGPGGDIVIPAHIGGVAVKHIGEAVFQSRDDITGVVIQEGVQTIGNYAFGDSGYIASISIPASVNSIGEGAFWRTAITSIEIPEGITEISSGLFALCGSLESVGLPQSIKSIGDSAFNNCSSLTGVRLPSGLKSIGRNAFHASGLTEVVIPDGVESIGIEAFSQCGNLTSLSLPESVREISGGILFCSEKATLILDSANPYFVMEGGVLFNTERTRLVYCAPQKGGWYDVPESVTTIDVYAFADCSKLSGVTIPAGLQTIESYAFVGCGAEELVFMGDRPAFSDAFAGAFGVKHIYYTEGAAGWPGEPVMSEQGPITVEPR